RVANVRTMSASAPPISRRDRSGDRNRSEILMVAAARVAARAPLVVARRERFVDRATAVDGLAQADRPHRSGCAEATEILVAEDRSDMVRRLADENRIARPRDAFSVVEYNGRRPGLRTHPGTVSRTDRDDIHDLPEAPEAQREHSDADGADDAWGHAT